jgi:glycosyltransferase involved in cell wall biosynthesis
VAVSFSIVTPCLNAEATIRETLRSVAGQDVEAVEHIIIDGGSTDGTLDIVRNAPGSVVVISEPDDGLSDAVNKGVRMARNDVVGWLNADDLYLPGALSRVADAFAARPDALWATGRCIIVNGQGKQIRRGVSVYKNALLRRWSFPLFLTQNFVSAPATFVRRDAFDLVGEFEERFRYSMDYDLWLKLGRRSPPIVIDAPLACFRMAEGSLSMTGFKSQFVEHAQNAREHGAGHPIAVAVNVGMSRVIVLVYRALQLFRTRMR